MADMVDSGYHKFKAWSQQDQAAAAFYNQFLGEFDAYMTADEANKRSDHVGKIKESGQQEFKRGWEKAQAEYLASR